MLSVINTIRVKKIALSNFCNFCNNFVEHRSIMMINFGIGRPYFNKFPITRAYFTNGKHSWRFNSEPASTLCVHDRRAASPRDVALCSHMPYDLLISQTLILGITEPGQCYRSGSINSLCEMTSWGDVWLTVGRASSTVFDQAIDHRRFKLTASYRARSRQLEHLL